MTPRATLPAPIGSRLPGPDYPFDDTVEREIGGTRFIIRTECGGAERLSEKITRLISSEREENCA